MVIWASLATAAAVALLILLIVYRRQVVLTCRRLAFIRTQKTNQRLTADLPFRELGALADSVNDLLDRFDTAQQTTRHSEAVLKETITNLSHDIRTPLTSLDGYFQLLVQSDSEEERRHYLEVIQNRLQSLKDMLEELFTYTKLQDAEYDLELARMDFTQCVCDTAFSFYDAFQDRSVTSHADFTEERLLIDGNEQAVRRIVQNILKNALTHGKSQISLALFQTGGAVCFRCENDVEHPEEIDVEQVFSRFYKADSARTRVSSGLGLSIAKGLAEKMNGTISAALQDDRFAVELRFPEAKAEQRKGEPKKPGK